jgi:hypothetical protein
VGDSHTRVCASNIQGILNKNFNVLGLIKSGFNTCTLADSAEETTGNLANNHVLVFCRVQMTRCYLQDYTGMNGQQNIKKKVSSYHKQAN